MREAKREFLDCPKNCPKNFEISYYNFYTLAPAGGVIENNSMSHNLASGSE